MVDKAELVTRDFADVESSSTSAAMQVMRVGQTIQVRHVVLNDPQQTFGGEHTVQVIHCVQHHVAHREQCCMVCLGLYCACLLVKQLAPENPTSQTQTLAFFKYGSQYPLLLQFGQRRAFVQPSAEFTIFSGSLRSYICLLFETFLMQPVKPV